MASGAGRLDAARSRCSARACRMIWAAPHSDRPAITAATTTSGHPVPVPNTPSAANTTATFAIASLREQIQTDRMLASPLRPEEHTSELQSLMRNSYAVFCLKKKKQHTQHNNDT